MLQRERVTKERTVPSPLHLAMVPGGSLAPQSTQTGFHGPHLPRRLPSCRLRGFLPDDAQPAFQVHFHHYHVESKQVRTLPAASESGSVSAWLWEHLFLATSLWPPLFPRHFTSLSGC